MYSGAVFPFGPYLAPIAECLQYSICFNLIKRKRMMAIDLFFFSWVKTKGDFGGYRDLFLFLLYLVSSCLLPSGSLVPSDPLLPICLNFGPSIRQSLNSSHALVSDSVRSLVSLKVLPSFLFFFHKQSRGLFLSLITQIQFIKSQFKS